MGQHLLDENPPRWGWRSLRQQRARGTAGMLAFLAARASARESPSASRPGDRVAQARATFPGQGVVAETSGAGGAGGAPSPPSAVQKRTREYAGCVADALTKRRQLDARHRDHERRGRREIAPSCTSWVEGSRTRSGDDCERRTCGKPFSAEALDLRSLDGAKANLALEGGASMSADFVEEQRAPFGLLEHAGSRTRWRR